MIRLETIFSSNIPVDCYILKGRLETDGIDCFVFDENIIWAHPFRAVAIGGVKLKVPLDQIELAQKSINAKNEWTSNLKIEQNRQNEILKIRQLIREDERNEIELSNIDSDILTLTEINEIIDNEKENKKISDKRLNFNIKQFWYELLDPDRNVLEYLRVKPTEYYIENDLVNNYNSKTKDKTIIYCPNCQSENVYYGYAIDFKLDILYLIFSLLIFTPFPPFRKKYYCFNCNTSFNKKGQPVT